MREYAEARGVKGVVAIVHPQIPGSSLMAGWRCKGVPAFVVDRADPEHWCWKPAAEDDPKASYVLGSSHQVVLRRGAAPSDPTIEQFDPAVEYKLFIVEEARVVSPRKESSP